MSAAMNGNENPYPAENETPSATSAPSSYNVIAQYIKDFSFENPKMPQILVEKPENPLINIDINVNAHNINESDYEVSLNLTARASVNDVILFNVELIYAGVFRIQNVAKEDLQSLILTACPHLLFPFARQIIADATRHGGYPPLMIEPIDFNALYRQRKTEEEAESSPVAN